MNVVTSPLPTLPDGGAAVLTMPHHTGPLVDAEGTMAFTTPEGRVGVLSKDGALDVLGDA